MGRKTLTKEHKAVLKETGYTVKQMDDFWDKLLQISPKVQLLHKNGLTWRDLHPNVIRQLPTEKERTLKYLEEERIKKEKAEKEAEKKAKIAAIPFEVRILKKIEDKEELSKSELQELVGEYEIESQYGENRRWSRSVTTIVKVSDKYFSINWEQGLTEYQENEFWKQPVPVEPFEYYKVVKVKEWKEIK